MRPDRFSAQKDRFNLLNEKTRFYTGTVEGEMDVSNQDQPIEAAPTGDVAGPGGEELIETVAALTGLPEPWVHQELGRIVENAGHSTGTLTLDQLREAMLAYLESLQSVIEEPTDAAAASNSEPVVLSETGRLNLALVSD